jgi:hypothetical protein
MEGTTPQRFLLNDRAQLLLGTHEEHAITTQGDFTDRLLCGLEPIQRLTEVDDVDAVALGEDEGLHLRVPTPGLVAEVHSGL